MLSRLIGLVAIGGIILSVPFLPGCDDKDVPYVDDREEIIRYIYESPDARELFGTTDLITEDPYRLHWDTGAVYRQEVDSTQRTVTVLLGSKDRPLKVGTLPAFFQSAEVVVDDILYLTRSRVADGDTTEAGAVLGITRHGHFLKMGDDERSFLGWKLWGYSGGTGNTNLGQPAYMIVRKPDGGFFLGNELRYDQFTYVWADTFWIGGQPVESLFVGDTRYAYIRLDKIDTLSLGDSLVLSVDWDEEVNYLATYDGPAGPVMERLEPASATVESLVIHLPEQTAPIWNLIVMQEALRRPIPGSTPQQYSVDWAGWVIPYRIPQ